MSGPENSLWCWILGENPPRLRVFLVKLSHEATVDELKKVIKEACSVKFRQIFAHTLDLYKVSIPLVDIDKKLEHIQDPKDIASAVKLQPLDDLSNVFRDPPAHNHVHIIVQSPITSECWQLFWDVPC
jgi:Crinkler effector protein N-terminal domain